MKTSKPLLSAIIVLAAMFLNAQEKPIYEMLGENVRTVINTYGKPAKHDKSDPLLEMVFYKTSNIQMCFVATDNKIFQAELTRGYNSKQSAEKLFNEYLNGVTAAGLTRADSSELKRSFYSDDRMIDFEVFDNKVKNQYELRVKAQKF